MAALKISASRTVNEKLFDGIISAQNLPLFLALVVIILSAELAPRNRLTISHALLFLVSSLILFATSFYLPPSGGSSEYPAILAYSSVMVQLSTAFTIFFFRTPGFRRILTSFVLFVGVFTLTGFLFTYSSSSEEGRQLKSESDAVVVLGASVWGKHKPSPILRGRLEAAISLFESGHTRRIVATGGTRRFDTVESEVEAWYLRQRGIPDSALIVEHDTFCTSQQVAYIKRVLIDSLGMKNIVVVTDDWHLPRALLMCRLKRAIVQGTTSGYRMYRSSELYSRLRESGAIQAFLLFGA